MGVCLEKCIIFLCVIENLGGVVEIIDKLSKKSRKSYNYIVNSMIEFAINNMDMTDIKDIK